MPQSPIRKFPEAPRRRALTVCPKPTRRCAWSAIRRADDRLARVMFAAARIDRRDAR